MGYSLDGRSIVVTGGASGIGAATVRRAAALGARVTIADLDEPRGQAIADEIGAAGGTAHFVRTDIADAGDVAAMVDAATSRYGPLHGAFNNAGLEAYSHRPGNAATAFADLPVEAFRRSQDVNVVGTFLCMQREIAAMLETGGGAIVNTSSGAGVLAIADAADYVTAKHAVIGLTKSAALDYATKGIRVNALIPGVIRTGMMESAFAGNPDLWDWAADMQPNKRIGEPVEVAEAALWLLSDAASLVTGISLPVDGGFTMV